MSLQLDKAMVEKGRALSNEEDDQVEKIIRDSLLSGRVGALKVDPQSLVFEPQSSKNSPVVLLVFLLLYS